MSGPLSAYGYNSAVLFSVTLHMFKQPDSV